MIPVKQIDPEDLPLYAMALLPPEDMEEMTENLQYSRDGRRRLAELYEELSMYALSVDLETPSAVARQRLLKQLAKEKKVIAIDRDAAPAPAPITKIVEVQVPRTAAQRALPWVGWAVAAGLALTATYMHQENNTQNAAVASGHQNGTSGASSAEANAVLAIIQDPSAQKAVLTSSPTRAFPEARVAYNPEKGSLVLFASNLGSLAPNKVYELWVIPADGGASIPAGTFHPDAQGFASLVLPQLPKGVVAGQFGVTVEPDGGSPTPTFPIVLGGKPA
jgi:anti-sigma-K factor RskA